MEILWNLSKICILTASLKFIIPADLESCWRLLVENWVFSKGPRLLVLWNVLKNRMFGVPDWIIWNVSKISKFMSTFRLEYAAKMYRRSTNFVINRVLLSKHYILRNVSKISKVSPFERVDLEIPRKCVEDQRNLKICMIWTSVSQCTEFLPSCWSLGMDCRSKEAAFKLLFAAVCDWLCPKKPKQGIVI